MALEIPQKQKEIIEGLLNKVKSMSDDDFKKMLSEFSKFHNYSFFNQCLVYASGASQVAGYKQWQEKFKRQVVKKENHKIGAIQILAPKIGFFIKVNGELERTTQKKFESFNGEKKSFPVAFFPVTVFDISDTEGPEIEEKMTPKSAIGFSEVEKAAVNLGYTVEKRPLSFNLGGYISKKEIVVNSNRQESANVGTLIHELAHGELGHTDTNCDHETDIKEQQAETVTYMVCLELGIERNSQFYLKSWGMSENILQDFAQLSKVANKLVREIRSNSLRYILD
jgi:hypothetical protein